MAIALAYTQTKGDGHWHFSQCNGCGGGYNEGEGEKTEKVAGCGLPVAGVSRSERGERSESTERMTVLHV